MQCVAVCCSVLQCVVVCCSELQCALHCVAVCVAGSYGKERGMARNKPEGEQPEHAFYTWCHPFVAVCVAGVLQSVAVSMCVAARTRLLF